MLDISEAKLKQFEKKGYSFQSLYKNHEELAQGLKDITKKTIWVKKGEKSYEQRSVGVGLNNGVKTLITDGLRDGEEVVTSVSEAMEGMPAGMKPKDGGSSNPFMPGPPEKKQR